MMDALPLVGTEVRLRGDSTAPSGRHQRRGEVVEVDASLQVVRVALHNGSETWALPDEVEEVPAWPGRGREEPQ